MILLLEGQIQRYPWGSRHLIQDLCGWTPDEQPIAELWFGSHPKAPSRVVGTEQTLLQLLRDDPEGLLGHEPKDDDQGLPFLLKLIAVDAPLSLQAHPNAKAAKQGYRREEKQHIALTARERSYPDPHHKPELLVALTDFKALAGFDEAREILAAMDLIESLELKGLLAPLRDGGKLAPSFCRILEAGAEARDAMLSALRQSHEKHRALSDGRGQKLRMAAELNADYPNDLGAILSLFLNPIVLRPGQALFVQPGLLHCYLQGLALEIMANSDNVLRCGLTKKHVDIPELLRVLDYSAVPNVLRGDVEGGSIAPGATAETVYGSPALEFELSRIELVAQEPVSMTATTAELVLPVKNPIVAQDRTETVIIAPGQALFVPMDSRYTLAGEGLCFRARSGEIS